MRSPAAPVPSLDRGAPNRDLSFQLDHKGGVQPQLGGAMFASPYILERDKQHRLVLSAIQDPELGEWHKVDICRVADPSSMCVFGLEKMPARLEVDQCCTHEGNAKFMNFSLGSSR
jgi:hypothetical protein